MKQGAPETETTTTPIVSQEEKVEKQLAEGQNESDDEDFAADTQEMEEAAESSSESEDEKEDSEVDEDYMVEIKGGKIQKMKFDRMDQESQEEVENEAKLDMLQKTLPDQDDEDGDYNPCHDTLSDVEVEDDENEDETAPAVKKLEALHKRTGAPLTEIEMNTDELKIPPAYFVAQVATGDDTENAMEE